MDGWMGPFVAVAAGDSHSLGLRSDGRVSCWGSNEFGQAPEDGVEGPFVAIAAGDVHSLGLRSDGRVTFWGFNDDGQAPAEDVTGAKVFDKA